MIPWLKHPSEFPSAGLALEEPNGLLAAGGALAPEWLLTAYCQGIFPWYMPGEPILWWNPNPRMVLYPHELHVHRSLGKVMRNRTYVIRFDTVFREVMEACAAPRDGVAGTWISEEVKGGYCALHEFGYAHSIETWIDGKLAGGLYGVAIGGMFFGESMFADSPDASKIAFAHFVPWLRQQGFGLIDCQMHTDHLARFGAREIPRDEFLASLAENIAKPGLPGKWSYEYINPEGAQHE